MKNPVLMSIAAIVLLPIFVAWLWVGPKAIRSYMDPPAPPYDHPSMLPGLVDMLIGCTAVAFLCLAVAHWVVRRRERR